MDKKNCYLTFSGGAVYGAYNIGAAKRLTEVYTPKTISGTSMGAIVALLTATGKLEQAEEILITFCDVKNILSSQPRFPLNLFTNFKRGGFFNQKKLAKMITDVVSKQDFKNCSAEIVVQTTNISNYQGVSFSSFDFDYDAFINILLASAAIPLLYEPRSIWNPITKRNDWFIDGFASDNIPVRAAYHHNHSKTKQKSNLEHFILVCSPPVRIENVQTPNVYEVATKTVDAILYNFDEKSLQRGFEKHWQDKRFKVLRNMVQYFDSSLDFDGEKIKKAIYGGYKDMSTLLFINRKNY